MTPAVSYKSKDVQNHIFSKSASYWVVCTTNQTMYNYAGFGFTLVIFLKGFDIRWILVYRMENAGTVFNKICTRHDSTVKYIHLNVYGGWFCAITGMNLKSAWNGNSTYFKHFIHAYLSSFFYLVFFNNNVITLSYSKMTDFSLVPMSSIISPAKTLSLSYNGLKARI